MLWKCDLKDLASKYYDPGKNYTGKNVPNVSCLPHDEICYCDLKLYIRFSAWSEASCFKHFYTNEKEVESLGE